MVEHPSTGHEALGSMCKRRCVCVCVHKLSTGQIEQEDQKFKAKGSYTAVSLRPAKAT